MSYNICPILTSAIVHVVQLVGLDSSAFFSLHGFYRLDLIRIEIGNCISYDLMIILIFSDAFFFFFFLFCFPPLFRKLPTNLHLHLNKFIINAFCDTYLVYQDQLAKCRKVQVQCHQENQVKEEKVAIQLI